MQHPGLNTSTLYNTSPAALLTPHNAESNSIQGRRASESRKDYLHRVLDRVTELGERKPPAKKEATCTCNNNHSSDPAQGASPPPPPPPSYDEALALGEFLDDKLSLDDDGTNEDCTSHAATAHSNGNNSRQSLRRSRPTHHTFSQTQEVDDGHRTQQPRQHRSAPRGSLVEQAHSLATEESVRAEMERIQREFAEVDEDTSSKMSRSTNRSRDSSMYKYPPALESTNQGDEEGSESGGSHLLIAKRENLPSMKDAQSRPYVG